MTSQYRRPLTRAQQLEISGRRLLEAAAELIAEKGWEATTAAEIGRRAGYSRAMVGQRFGSKDALLDQLLTLEYEDRLMPLPMEGTSGLEQLLTLFKRISAVYDDEPQFLEALFTLGFEAVKRSSPVKPRMAEWMNQIADLIEGALVAGVADQSISADVDVAGAVTDITSAVIGIAYGSIVIPGRFDLPREIEKLTNRVIGDYAAQRQSRIHCPDGD